jgi:hypothetical protein
MRSGYDLCQGVGKKGVASKAKREFILDSLFLAFSMVIVFIHASYLAQSHQETPTSIHEAALLPHRDANISFSPPCSLLFSKTTPY